MNTKLLFFDIDGTILSHRTKCIPDSAKAAIREARANGHLVFINTGRSMAEIDEEIIQIGFDGYVCGCGTYISFHDSVIFHKAIPADEIPILIKDLRKYKIDAILEGSTAIYYDDQTKSHLLKSHREQQKQIFHFNVLSWDTPDISFDKFTINPTKQESFDIFYEKYKNTYDYILHESLLYEIVPKGFSKASGVQFLLDYLKMPHENTYALGDSANDLAMLQYVKHSIAMGNSSDAILKVVTFVTEDIDNDGVAFALKHFNII